MNEKDEVRRKITPQGPRGGRVTIPPGFMNLIGVRCGDTVGLRAILLPNGETVIQLRAVIE